MLVLRELTKLNQLVDGVIDSKDPIYAKLRLWVDSNHDGVSQPSELYTLESKGIAALGLDYHKSGQQDKNGNRFGFEARLIDSAGGSADKHYFDVFLAFGGSNKKKK